MTISDTLNADYIERQYQKWTEEPDSVSDQWRIFFKGYEWGSGEVGSGEETCTEDKVQLQSRVDQLVHRYRDLGHLLSCLDPLVSCPTDHPLLNLSSFGLSEDDLGGEFYCGGTFCDRKASLKEIIGALKETYCRSIGVEFMHLQDPEERRWLIDRMEPRRNRPDLSGEDKRRILLKLFQANLFEQFLKKKYPGQTRFSVEGAESVIAMLDALISHVSSNGVSEVILGMAHRGRLNVQTNVLKKKYEDVFREFENTYDPDSLVGAGDVKYHNGYMADVDFFGRKVRLVLVNNPSHLESVDPVVQGLARARQVLGEKGDGKQVLPVLIHGDAAFAGQGIVSEVLNLSQLKGYKTGGTIHLVINNQIGYTTLPEDARSTRYSTDVAKMLMVPIFHVHGENPEAAVHLVKLAAAYRHQFGKDVVIDLVCYRRYGHNEGDEPYFTQPLMYDRIEKRPPLHELYTQQLKEENLVDDERLEKIQEDINQCLEDSLEIARNENRGFPRPKFYEVWDGLHGNYSSDPVDTTVPESDLVSYAKKLNTVPEGFAVFKKLKGLMDKRLEAVESGEGIDWGNAESLAFASLLAEDFPIRLSGQDSGRGTFSQRHSVLVDTKTSEPYVPLNALGVKQASFTVYDSALSEAGILAFEYGYSLAQPRGLVIWEAQFGDFANNAQAIIDLFIVSGEAKWQRLSGLTLLLPHGMEGLGPEHSSARPERFLQLCAHDNILVCNPTLPSQYFHLLRRQVKADYRKPLIVFTPKSLLRHPMAVSSLQDLAQGRFNTVLDAPNEPENPSRLVLCSGKVYYDLEKRRQEREDNDVAIVRLEQYYPFPSEILEKILSKYKEAEKWYWVQEEPSNMGPWNFVRHRLYNLMGRPFEYIGRSPSSSPATAFVNLFRKNQEEIITKAVGPQPDNE